MNYEQLTIFDFLPKEEEPRRIKVLNYFLEHMYIKRYCFDSQTGVSHDPTMCGGSCKDYSWEYNEIKIGEKQRGLYIDLNKTNEHFYYSVKETREHARKLPAN